MSDGAESAGTYRVPTYRAPAGTAASPVATISEAAGATQGVAWFAHIGGFLFGAFLVAFFLRDHGRRRCTILLHLQ